MVHRVVIAESTPYTVSPDDPPPLGGRTWGMIGAHLVDELTGKPPRTMITVRSDRAGLEPRVASDGLAGAVGVPLEVLSRLAIQNYAFNCNFDAEGYLPLRIPVTFPQDVTFPVTFTPISLGDLHLHRRPVVIEGRTVLAVAGATVPVAGATIMVTGIWNTPPPANILVPPSPPNLLALSPPLYLPRTAAGTTLRRREMLPVLGADKTLLGYAARGDASLQLSDHVGLSVGDIAVIDEVDPDLAEYLPITTITGFSTPNQPATITVAYPMAVGHRSGAIVRKVTPQVPGAIKPCARDAIADDTIFFLTTLSGLGAVHVVEIGGGALPVEYHVIRRFSVTSNAQGYYRLPPVSRIAQIQLQVADGVHTPLTPIISPDYSQNENRNDFVFK